MAGEALHYLELVELTRRIHAKQLSPVEATKVQLDRIAAAEFRPAQQFYSFAA
jgi:amidase